MEINTQRIGFIVLAALTSLLLQVVGPAGAFAQAWVPGKGWGTISIGYKNLYVKDHLDMNCVVQDKGHIRSNVLSLDLDYGIIRKLAVNIGLPFGMVKYNGSFP